jgi:hypothetical protein
MCGAHSAEGLGNFPLNRSIFSGSRRRALAFSSLPHDDAPRSGRELRACGNGCLAPKFAFGAVPSSQVLIDTTFSSPFPNYAGVSSGYAIAYGICYVIGCNYRNVTVSFVSGNVVAQNQFVYSVIFYALAGSSNLTVFPASLLAALPSKNASAAGSIAYGISFTQGGALSMLNGVDFVYSFSCTCTDGYSGADCTTIPPSPPPAALVPPPAPPIASWSQLDSGEAIAVDIPKGAFAISEGWYSQAFVQAVTELLGRDVYDVSVTSFQPSSVGTTVLFFNIVLFGFDYNPIADTFNAVQALFNCSGVPVVPGAPACPQLVALMQLYGLPVTAAFYNDQLVATGSTAPLQASNSFAVGTFTKADNGEAIALDVPYNVFAVGEAFYSAAFMAATAQALNISAVDIAVLAFSASSSGTTVIFFGTVMYGTDSSSSAVISNRYVAIQGLFTSSAIGAPATPAYAAALQEFGITAAAFYNDQLAA